MSWEVRQNGKRYYTRSRRLNGRVLREYIGGGTLGELAELLDIEEREERRSRAEAIRDAKLRLDRLDERLMRFETLADQVGRGLLLEAGYYQHHRHEWRKRNVHE